MGVALALAGPMASSAQPSRSAQPSQNAVQTQESRGQNRRGQGADGEYSVRIYTPEENVRRLMERGLIREARQDRVLFARLYGIGGEELVRQLSRDMFLRGLAAYGRFRGAVVMGEEDLKAMLEWISKSEKIEIQKSLLSRFTHTDNNQEPSFYYTSRITHLATASCGDRTMVSCIHATSSYPYFEEVLRYHNICMASLITAFPCNGTTLDLEFWEVRPRHIYVWQEDKNEENVQHLAEWLKKELVEKIAEGRLEESRVDIRGLITGIENNDIIWGGNWTYYPNKKTFLPHLEVRVGGRREEVFIERRVLRGGMILANARNTYWFTDRDITTEGTIILRSPATVRDRERAIRILYNGGRRRLDIWDWEYLQEIPEYNQHFIIQPNTFSEILRENPLRLLGKTNESLGDLLKRLMESGEINIIERERREVELGGVWSGRPTYHRIRQRIRVNENQGRIVKEILERLVDQGNHNKIRIGKWRGNEFIVYARPRQIGGLPPTYDLIPWTPRIEVGAGRWRRRSRRLIERRERGNVVFIDRVFSHREIANKIGPQNRADYSSPFGEAMYVMFDGGGVWRRNGDELDLLEIPHISIFRIKERIIGERIGSNSLKVFKVTYSLQRHNEQYSRISRALWTLLSHNRHINSKHGPISRIIINGQPLSKKEIYRPEAIEITIYHNRIIKINTGEDFHQIDERSFREAMEFARRRYELLDWSAAEFIGWTPRVIIFEPWLGRLTASEKAVVFVVLPKKNGHLIKERFEDGERVFGIMIEVPRPVYIGGKWHIWRRTVKARPAFVKAEGFVNAQNITFRYFASRGRIAHPLTLRINHPELERIMQLRRQMMDQLRQRRLARR